MDEGFPSSFHSLSGLKFPGSDAVFIEVMAVHLHDIERGVAVLFPAAAEIEYVVNASYLITA
jgi:hypothetical protein